MEKNIVDLYLNLQWISIIVWSWALYFFLSECPLITVHEVNCYQFPVLVYNKKHHNWMRILKSELISIFRTWFRTIDCISDNTFCCRTKFKALLLVKGTSCRWVWKPRATDKFVVTSSFRYQLLNNNSNFPSLFSYTNHCDHIKSSFIQNLQ